ncbi:Gti1/Pac2 family-domain-containing protein [Phyllosticta citriasiana]|uniref:Gti1/Pac2 family-domain-containing protein n=1 Tax=Phyllosticta citriasiana TaxID=595635 RepID=A0ABR1L243_9PEZI
MLRVLHPESRFGGDHYRENVVGRDAFAGSLHLNSLKHPSSSSSSPPSSTAAMDFHDDHRAATATTPRNLIPMRSNSGYMPPTSSPAHSPSGPYQPSIPGIRHDSTFSPPFGADSPLNSSPSYFAQAASTPKNLGLIPRSNPVPSHALGQQRFVSGGYADSQTSDSDRGVATRHTSASPVAPHVGSIPPVPSNLNANMQPTWHGFVHTTQDALTIIEACLNGTLIHCPRRPHDRERASLIRSGSVFVYEETTSGIKRWTDGLSWSPSRIMGNFLVYRELERPFPPGEKKRANRARNKSARSEPYSRTNNSSHYNEEPPFEIPDSKDRKITGSLVDSYDFKRGGLLKRTLSVTVNGCTHHLIAYYTIEDARDQTTLFRPGHDSRLANCHPRKELITDQKFRSPIQDPDDVVPYGAPFMTMGHMPGAHLGSYASQYHPHHSYQPVIPGLPAHTAWGHTSSQSMGSLSASSSGSFGGLPSSSPSPGSMFGGIGHGAHLMHGSRPSGELVSPLNSLHLSSSPGHQSRYPVENVAPPVTGSVSLDYQSFPAETSYQTAQGSGFSHGFGFEQTGQALPHQAQFHGSVGEAKDEPQVATENYLGEGPGQMLTSGGFSVYPNSDPHHTRHDTMGAFDEKAPNFSNHFT